MLIEFLSSDTLDQTFHRSEFICKFAQKKHKTKGYLYKLVYYNYTPVESLRCPFPRRVIINLRWKNLNSKSSEIFFKSNIVNTSVERREGRGGLKKRGRGRISEAGREKVRRSGGLQTEVVEERRRGWWLIRAHPLDEEGGLFLPPFSRAGQRQWGYFSHPTRRPIPPAHRTRGSGRCKGGKAKKGVDRVWVVRGQGAVLDLFFGVESDADQIISNYSKSVTPLLWSTNSITNIIYTIWLIILNLSSLKFI